ncbi:hypothetical protein EJB05_17431, partial [Eragrostis curvula]
MDSPPGCKSKAGLSCDACGISELPLHQLPLVSLNASPTLPQTPPAPGTALPPLPTYERLMCLDSFRCFDKPDVYLMLRGAETHRSRRQKLLIDSSRRRFGNRVASKKMQEASSSSSSPIPALSNGYQPLQSIYLGFLVIWAASGFSWAFTSWRNRHFSGYRTGSGCSAQPLLVLVQNPSPMVRVSKFQLDKESQHCAHQLMDFLMLCALTDAAGWPAGQV